MDVLMPQLGETVSEGKITQWFKSAGDAVKPGDNLFEIETDKVSMEVPSTAAGVLAEIRVRAGEVAPVGAVVAVGCAGAGAVTFHRGGPTGSLPGSSSPAGSWRWPGSPCGAWPCCREPGRTRQAAVRLSADGGLVVVVGGGQAPAKLAWRVGGPVEVAGFAGAQLPGHVDDHDAGFEQQPAFEA